MCFGTYLCLSVAVFLSSCPWFYLFLYSVAIQLPVCLQISVLFIYCGSRCVCDCVSQFEIFVCSFSRRTRFITSCVAGNSEDIANMKAPEPKPEVHPLDGSILNQEDGLLKRCSTSLENLTTGDAQLSEKKHGRSKVVVVE